MVVVAAILHFVRCVKITAEERRSIDTEGNEMTELKELQSDFKNEVR